MRLRILSSFLITLLLTMNGIAQSSNAFLGSWEGTLNVGVELRIVLHIKDTGNAQIITLLDSPDQAAFGIPASKTLITGNQIVVDLNELSAKYTGKLLNDSTIEGIFNQQIELPLVLKKQTKPSTLKRPQHPQPPYPYKIEEIEHDTEDRSMHYGATITIPQGKGPFPAAILVSGSGPQNRDSEVMGHKIFAVLADHLTRNGIVVLRVDDRGVGKTTGEFNGSTSLDFAKDVDNNLKYLLTRPEVDKNRIGIIGHSEGGLIAPLVAAGRKDIDFLVLLAAPGIPISELMVEQNAAIRKSASISQEAIDVYLTLYRKMSIDALSAPDTALARQRLVTLVQKWIETTPAALVSELGLNDENSRQQLITALASEFSMPWFRYFLAFDPTPYLQKINSKVLALNGSRDIQVIPQSNLAGIKAALKKGRTKNFSVQEIEGLNHLFQTCVKCNIPEYLQLEETFAPAALKIITDWLDKNVK